MWSRQCQIPYTLKDARNHVFISYYLYLWIGHHTFYWKKTRQTQTQAKITQQPRLPSVSFSLSLSLSLSLPFIHGGECKMVVYITFRRERERNWWKFYQNFVFNKRDSVNCICLNNLASGFVLDQFQYLY